ncbi:hypothetical protein GWE18_40075 [Bradyrhizobium sp. CSA112]|uniref:hypothetical protein n=1 Tax=Bradyrhizobium sp. CSA112 TaxID=2699170 RepID=UPI0023AF8AC7|nr:hypothetical protein [Bradyrhizobium sp. CSA112]MDE5458827.1 hypothetical protein [Bradyrhizobium sp. CSA112]
MKVSLDSIKKIPAAQSNVDIDWQNDDHCVAGRIAEAQMSSGRFSASARIEEAESVTNAPNTLQCSPIPIRFARSFHIDPLYPK